MMEVDSTGKAEYHYTETVTIPQKYFLSPKGRITLIVKGVEKLPNGEIEDRVFIVTDLYYVAHDDKIELVSHDKWYQYIILS